jgi:hypothetical protein
MLQPEYQLFILTSTETIPSHEHTNQPGKKLSAIGKGFDQAFSPFPIKEK